MNSNTNNFGNPDSPDPDDTNGQGVPPQQPNGPASNGSTPPPPAGQNPNQPYGAPAFNASAFQQQSSGFLKNLFDLSFSNFVTISLAKVIYIISLVLIGLTYLYFVVASFLLHPAVGILVLLFGWIIAFLYVMFVRVSIEVFVAIIRVAQNTTEIRDHHRAGR